MTEDKTRPHEQPPPAADDNASRPAGRRPLWLRLAGWAALALLIGLGVSYGLIKLRIWRPPYPSIMRAASWHIAAHQEAYNADVVDPGKVYRSCRPDENYLRYAHDELGVRHVITLNKKDLHRLAPIPPGLDMQRTGFSWSPNAAPPRDELRRVLEIMTAGEPVLVHCYAGADRTSYAVAAYRLLIQNWDIEPAFQEMHDHWHWRGHDTDSALQADLRKLVAEPPDWVEPLRRRYASQPG